MMSTTRPKRTMQASKTMAMSLIGFDLDFGASGGCDVEVGILHKIFGLKFVAWWVHLSKELI